MSESSAEPEAEPDPSNVDPSEYGPEDVLGNPSPDAEGEGEGDGADANEAES